MIVKWKLLICLEESWMDSLTVCVFILACEWKGEWLKDGWNGEIGACGNRSKNMNEKSGLRWNLKRIFRVLGKFLLIILCFIISLLLISVIVIQFRPIRQFALNKLLDSVTQKTNSIISAKDLHFYFTGNVELEVDTEPHCD